jgi:GWxTD domain-containing protein
MKRRGVFTTLLTVTLFSSLVVIGQQKTPTSAKQSKEEQAKAKAREQELTRADKNWLEQDVGYIITDDEKRTFKSLSTPEEREQFKENFWLRRDPTPDSIENEFREEHYERIAYANERFASGKPGWKTDRGRIWILYGKPDEINDHPSGGTYERPFAEGGGTTQTYPFVIWTYRYLESVHRNNVELEFVDPSLSGEFRLTIDPYEKDAMLHIPGAGLTRDEEANGGDKSDRVAGIDGGDPTRLGTDSNTQQRYSQFDRLDLYANIFKPPEVKFKDLEAIVTTKLSFNTLPFNMRIDFVRVTEESVLMPITFSIAYKDLAFQEKEGIYECVGHVFAVITSVGGKRITTIEPTITKQFPAALYPNALKSSAVFQQTIPLRPGLYKIDLVIKDVNSGNVGILNKSFVVPRIPDDRLAMSSLILADRIEGLPPRSVGADQFALAGAKVVPNVKDEFTRDQKLNLWLQVYSLKVDEGTHKPSATIETLVTRNGSVVKRITEDSAEFSGAAQQMTVTQSLPLTDFEPGDYTVQVKVTDNLTKEMITSPGKTVFKVR